VAASEAAKARTEEANNSKQKEATASADSAEPDAHRDLLAGRQPRGISSAVAPVIPGSGRRKEGTAMKPVIRYRSQLLFRKSYKTSRVIRIRPARKAALVVRPARADPQINTYEYATD
jgi:hypothetical protein